MSDSLAGVLLVCDLDGTLLDSHSEISPQNLAAVLWLLERGGLFTVATGRNRLSVARFLPLLPLNAPAILYNGAMIYDFHSQTVLWSTTLPLNATAVIRLLRDIFPGIGVEIYHGEAVYVVSENNFITGHLAREHLMGIASKSLGEIPVPWHKALLAWDPEKIDLVEAYLRRKGLSFSSLRSDPCYLEILPGKISKGSALRILIRALGIPRSRVVAMGDQPNDLEMIKIAGWGIAVANAHQSLKSRASSCCADHDRHAVAEVIGWIAGKRPGDGSPVL